MPFFSFVLNKDYNSSQLDSNINERIILQKYTRYYCKNTTIWRNLKSKKYSYLVDNISYEKLKDSSLWFNFESLKNMKKK